MAEIVSSFYKLIYQRLSQFLATGSASETQTHTAPVSSTTSTATAPDSPTTAHDNPDILDITPITSPTILETPSTSAPTTPDITQEPASSVSTTCISSLSDTAPKTRKEKKREKKNEERTAARKAVRKANIVAGIPRRGKNDTQAAEIQGTAEGGGSEEDMEWTVVSSRQRKGQTREGKR